MVVRWEDGSVVWFPYKGDPCTGWWPHATTVGVSGPSSQGDEPMVQGETDPSRGKSSTASKAPDPAPPDPLASGELGALALGLMSNLNEMVDMMLRGPLASLCQEEGVALYKRFTSSSTPK